MLHNSRPFRPNKLMGQNFLVSRLVLKKIIAAAGCSPKKIILEIGPGLGALTRDLAKYCRKVIAVEKDLRFVAALEKNLSEKKIANVKIIQGDILKIDFGGLGLGEHYSVVANIPYYLTSRLIRMLLEHRNPPEEIFLMVQKEVAARIIAKPPRMNLLALSVQACAKPKILFLVPASAFSPKPKVDSAFIRISGIGKKLFANPADEKRFFEIARAAFGGKRKTLDNSLAHNLKISKTRVTEILKKLSLAGRRPETLSLGDWLKIADAVGG